VRRGRTIARQRQLIAELIVADPSRSNYAVGRELGCSHHTVARQREALGQLPAANGRAGSARAGNAGHENLMPPAGPGNDRAVTHGSHSEIVVAPVRERHLETLRQRFPDEPDPVLWIAASRAARIEVLSEYLDANGLMKRGEIRSAATELTKLETSLERQLAQLTERAKERRSPGASLATVLAEIAETT
jgi:hypothetical protein